jgi:cell division protease FtsH
MTMAMRKGERSVGARLVRHWLKRLRHEAERSAIDRAIRLGLLRRDESGLWPVIRVGETIAGSPLDRVRQLLDRGMGLASHGETVEPMSFWDDAPKREPASRRLVIGDEAAKIDRMDLLRLVRSHATPPSASNVAVLLMLADAVERSGHSLPEVLAILRRPKPVIAAFAETSGWEEVFVELIRSGLVLPGSSWSSKGLELRSTGTARVGDNSRRVFVHFDGRDLGSDGSDLLERQVGFAIQNPHAILATADDVILIPQGLMDAADLTLDCGVVTQELIAKTLHAVLGETPAWARQSEPDERGDRASESNLSGCELLALPDLALAIRPGMTSGRSIDVLRTLIKRRSADGGKPARSSGRKPAHADASRSGSSKSRRGWAGSGSTLIVPAESENSTGGKTRPPSLTVETLSGYGAARDWALALKEDLALWKAGTLPWDQMSTRLLLAGPPGTGKTTFARALGNTLQVPLLATSVSIWLEPSHLGDVLARMAAAFAEAQSHAPCLLFIDEIDGIGRRCHSGEHSEYWNAVVNRALELMDGAVKSPGIVLVGATNHPAIIDPALLRSGRLETRIDIPMPDVDALVGILRHHLGGDVDGVLTGASASSPDDTSVLVDYVQGAGHDAEPNAAIRTLSPVGRRIARPSPQSGGWRQAWRRLRSMLWYDQRRARPPCAEVGATASDRTPAEQLGSEVNRQIEEPVDERS